MRFRSYFALMLLALGTLGLSGQAWGQTTIFSENVGTPSGTTLLGTYTGWQNNGTLTFGGTGDVRNNQNSTGYTGSSGGGNVFLTNNGSANFTIGSINTLNYSSFVLSFGAFKSTTASNLTELTIGYSASGPRTGSVSFATQPTGSGTANWRLVTATSTPLVGSANLSLTFTNTSSGTGSPQFRLDDIKLTGTLRTAATTLSWNGAAANGNWFDGNWSGTNAPTASISGDSLQFAGTTQTATSNNVTSLTVGSITFNSGAGAFTNGGNSITLNGDITNSSSNTQTINHAIVLSSGSHNIATTTHHIDLGGALSGTGASVTKTGNGMLTLTGANTYTGTTTVNAGILRAGVDSAANISGAFGLNSNVTLANTAGATLDLNGWNNQIGSLNGGGTTGGNVTLGAGTLTVGGGTTAASTATYAGDISGNGGVTKIGAGVQILSGTNTYTGVTTVNTGSGAGALVFNTQSSLYNGNSVDWNATNLVVNSGGILAVTLGGVNGFSATQAQSVSQIGSSSGGFITGSFFGIDTSNGSQTYANVIADTNGGNNAIGFAKLGANTLTLTGENTYSLGSNATRVLAGTLQIGDGGTTGKLGGVGVVVSSGATLAFNRSDDISMTTNISGAGGLTKLGDGTLTLINPKSYTGATNVNAGTLLVNGSTAAGSTVSVASGARLGGSGTVSGPITVQDGGRIFGGNGTNTGTLTVGNVTVNANGNFAANIAESGTNSTLVFGNNTIDFITDSKLKLTGLTGFVSTEFGPSSSYTLGTFTSADKILRNGGVVADSATDYNGSILGEYVVGTGDVNSRAVKIDLSTFGQSLNDGDRFVLQRTGNNLVLNFSPVPEPASMLAVCGLVVGGFVAVRKLRRKGKPADVTPAA